jgi:hypothetical protein
VTALFQFLKNISEQRRKWPPLGHSHCCEAGSGGRDGTGRS